MNNVLLTILTCTYNRGAFLNQIFKCLEGQTIFNFQWLIIDDGSTDDTETIVNSLKSNQFDIDYYKKKNGGKHTAINYAMPYIKGKLVLFLDSDDYLTKDAVEVISNDWKKISTRTDISGISYMKSTSTGRFLSKKPPQDYFRGDYISYRINKEINGDQCEVIQSKILKKYPFPEIPGEKFLSESWLWFKIAEHYQMIYRPKSIYIAEYLPGGLTKSGKRLIMRNPQGGMLACKMYFKPEISIKARIKKTILFNVYAFCSKDRYMKSIMLSHNIFLCVIMFPFSCFFYVLWGKGKK